MPHADVITSNKLRATENETASSSTALRMHGRLACNVPSKSGVNSKKLQRTTHVDLDNKYQFSKSKSCDLALEYSNPLAVSCKAKCASRTA